MSKLRERVQQNKISKKLTADTKCSSAQYPWLSFQSVTKNSRYNLENLKQGKEREVTLDGLYHKLYELSCNNWLYWMQKPKTVGLETIEYGDINFAASDNVTLSKDTKLYVFRFDTYKGKNAGRILGYKNAPCSVLHIIGYDLDYSAYDHG